MADVQPRDICMEHSDYEDGIIAACAIVDKADAAITRDTKAFSGQSFLSFSPEQFVKALGYEDIALK